MMLKTAAVGIGVCQREGAAAEALQQADAVVSDILDGLDLLRFPKRLLATLRA
jgi:soluble P-type ATPase